jgi:hypothetical protein
MRVAEASAGGIRGRAITMVVPRDFVLRAASKIIDNERREILKTLSRTDSLFSQNGGVNSSSWRSERHQVIVAGVTRAGDRAMAEVRVHAGAKAPTFAEDAGLLVAHLGNDLVQVNRKILMQGETEVSIVEIERSCQDLADALRGIYERIVDDLKHRPLRKVSTSRPPLARRQGRSCSPV